MKLQLSDNNGKQFFILFPKVVACFMKLNKGDEFICSVQDEDNILLTRTKKNIPISKVEDTQEGR